MKGLFRGLSLENVDKLRSFCGTLGYFSNCKLLLNKNFIKRLSWMHPYLIKKKKLNKMCLKKVYCFFVPCDSWLLLADIVWKDCMYIMYRAMTCVVRKVSRRHSGATSAKVIHPARSATARQMKNSTPDKANIELNNVKRRKCCDRWVHGVIASYKFGNKILIIKYHKYSWIWNWWREPIHIQICLDKVEHEYEEIQ